MSSKFLKFLLVLIYHLIFFSNIFGQVSGGFQGSQILRNKPSFDYDELSEIDENEIINADDLEGLFSRAIKMFENGEIELAKKDLNHIINISPEFGGSYYFRSLCFKSENKIDSAIIDLEKSTSLPNFQYHGPSLLELGYIYSNLWQFEKANFFFEKALKILPDNVEVIYALGYLNFRWKKHDIALSFVHKSIELYPEFTDSYYLLINIYLEKNNLKEARKVIDRLIDKNQNNEKNLFLKSLLDFQVKDINSAISTINRVIQINSKNHYAYKVLGSYYYQIKKNDKGFYNLAKALSIQSLDPNHYGLNEETDFEIKLNQILLYVSSKIDSYEEDIRKFHFEIIAEVINEREDIARNRLVNIEKKYINIPISLLMIRSFLFEKKQLEDYWETDNLKIIETDSSHYHVYRSLGKFYEKQKDFDKAENAFTKMINLNKKIADGYKLRGSFRYEATKYIKAVQDFNIFLNNHRYNTNVLLKRADSYMKLGYLSNALKEYRSLLEIDFMYVNKQTYMQIMSIKLILKDTLGAIEIADEVIEKMQNPRAVWSDLDFKKHEVLNIRGTLKESMKSYTEAIDDFSASIESNEFFYLPRFNRAKVYFEIKEYDIALTKFNFILENWVDEPSALYWRARTKLKLNDKNGAIKDLKKAKKLGVQEAISLLSELSN